MSDTIPPAPGPDWTFNPPPGWAAPTGFDPRNGVLPDPTWPQAPEGWAFWTKSEIPAAAKPSFVERIGGPRVLVGAGVLAAIAIRVAFSFLGAAHSPTDGIGSCWKPSTGSKYAPVDCNDGKAAYKVVAQASDPESCPGTTDSYLDTVTPGPSRYECLAPVTH